MITSESVAKVIPAIHAVQQAIEVIGRGEKATVKTTKGEYSYSYASLPSIWVEIKGELAKNHLTVLQPPVFNISDQIETWVFHDSGEYVMASMRLIITRDDPQGFGSAVTYARRYALLATLGLVTDDDNDATTQRKATGDMRQDWVRAYTVMSKKLAPDHQPTYKEFNTFMIETYGKHPNDVLAKDHQQVLDTINAFNTEEV